MAGAAVRFMVAGGRAGRGRGALVFVGVFMGVNLLLGATGLGDLLAGAALGWKAHPAGFLAGAALSFLPGRGPPPHGLPLVCRDRGGLRPFARRTRTRTVVCRRGYDEGAPMGRGHRKSFVAG